MADGAGTSRRVDIIGRAVACAVVRYWPAAHDKHVTITVAVVADINYLRTVRARQVE